MSANILRRAVTATARSLFASGHCDEEFVIFELNYIFFTGPRKPYTKPSQTCFILKFFANAVRIVFKQFFFGNFKESACKNTIATSTCVRTPLFEKCRTSYEMSHGFDFTVSISIGRKDDKWTTNNRNAWHRFLHRFSDRLTFRRRRRKNFDSLHQAKTCSDWIEQKLKIEVENVVCKTKSEQKVGW